MAKILMQGKERFMCPVCENERIEPGQKYCQICGEALEWKEEGENGTGKEIIQNHLTNVPDANTRNMDADIKETIELLRGMQNPLQDYADMVGTPIWAYGHRYVYPDPEDYAIEKAISALEEQNRHRWIPVEERLPKLGEPVWATVKHSKWISDYDADWLPEEKKTYHPENYGVYKAEYIGEGIWQYSDDYNEWVYCDLVEKEKRNLANVYDTVTAWMPLPEPYRPEE